MVSFTLVLTFAACLLMAQTAPTLPMLTNPLCQMGMGMGQMGYMGQMGQMGPLGYLCQLGWPMGGQMGGYMGYKDKDGVVTGEGSGSIKERERQPTPADLVAPMAEVAEKVLKGEIADIPEKIMPKPILEAAERLLPGNSPEIPLPVQPRSIM